MTGNRSGAKRARGTSLATALGSQPYDLIVVGAGINGCGITRDAAKRGLTTLLVDMHDIGAETTAWSTRLIHGGLRYLEHGEVGLVRESLHERATLLRIAPHLVRPLRFLLPVYSRHRRGPLTIRAGMLAYDLLAATARIRPHRILSRTQAVAMEPGLDARELRAAAMYFDAQVTFPERLALENALDAAGHSATIATHTQVEAVQARGSEPTILTLRDMLDRSTHMVSGRVIVNATGPWLDSLLGGNALSPMIGGTRGSHIVVDRFPGAPRSAVYAEARRDGRPFFVIPWNGRYLVGTTDSRYAGDPASVSATSDEVRYLLEQTNCLFPSSGLQEDDVQFTYAGVRPLPASTSGSEAAITRRHIIRRHDPPHERLLSVVGGKLTTYRKLAEQVTDRVVQLLDIDAAACTTDNDPLPGARSNVVTMTDRSQPPSIAAPLRAIYGSGTPDVLGYRADGDTGTLEAQTRYALRHEFAETVADVLLRRTMRGLQADLGIGALDAVVQAAAAERNWDSERQESERAAYLAYIRRFAVPGTEPSHGTAGDAMYE
jgi:glycerol-3-phosphate dehydrogenase